ncbi:MAG: hypothetical protein IMW89_12550 [Ktedonobacteraceae bacterium]|nr:hypothetical protein [Ktedonobacteraceae bacterium]
MDNGIDASLGLAIVLNTLQRYQKQGMLQAEIVHVPGIRGRCQCYIFLTGGKITSCSVEDATGRRFPITIDTIINIDEKKGPFAWVFRPQLQSRPRLQSQPPRPQQVAGGPDHLLKAQSPAPLVPDEIIPVPLVQTLDLDRFTSLTYNQRLILGWLFSMIDGSRTVADIKAMLPRLHGSDVEKGLLFLKQSNVIAMTDERK